MSLTTRVSDHGRHARVRAAAIALLLAAGAIWCSQAVRKAERRTGNDLVGYLEASRALYDGRDPYHLRDRFPYIYPLFLATVIRPFAALPQPVASVLWFALQAGCLWFVLGLAARKEISGSLAPAFRRKDLVLVAALVVAVFGDVVQSELLNGQVNVVVLALVVAAVHLGDRRPRVAASLLGAAIAVKLTPALFLLFWAVERRFRIAVESLVWAGVFALAPWLVVQDRLWPLYGTYVREFILARTTSVDPHAQAIFMTPYGFWGWLTGAAPGRLVVAGMSAAVVAALVVWHARRRARRPATTAATAWVYAAAAPLLSPMSEVHHLTFLIPAATVTTTARRPLVWIGAAAFAVLIWIARFDRTGPWYFLSILCLLATVRLALSDIGAVPSGQLPRDNSASDVIVGRRADGPRLGADPNGQVPRNSGASDASAGRRWGWGPSAS